jgi:hypothetical protein
MRWTARVTSYLTLTISMLHLPCRYRSWVGRVMTARCSRYENTRKRLLSRYFTNEYYFDGNALQGMESVQRHTPIGIVWPMAFVIKALTTDGSFSRSRFKRANALVLWSCSLRSVIAAMQMAARISNSLISMVQTVT